MAKINNSRLIDIIATQTTAYTPIVEAIANSIDAIEERKARDGEITIELVRAPQLIKTGDDASPVTTIRITDNGVGFTENNRNSFDTLLSTKKLSSGGKGFGRLTYLKYFTSTKIESTYKDDSGWHKRRFTFIDGEEYISNETIDDSESERYQTVVELSDIRKNHQGKLNKKLDTIARKLFELLLPYFVTDGYKPPKIRIIDPSEKDEAILNQYLDDQKQIQLIADEKIDVEGIGKESFQIKLFKVYYSTSQSAVALTANHRLVTSTPMHRYDPEFSEGFSDRGSGEEVSGNYVLKAYVIGDYLDKHVSTARGGFLFNDEDETALLPLSKRTIEKAVTKLVSKKFEKELEPKKRQKAERIQAIVDEEMPWNRSLVSELDLDSLPFTVSEKDIDTAINRIAYDKEQEVRASVNILLKNNNADDLDKKVEEITTALTTLGQNKLAHYVSLRRAIIDIFDNSLKLRDTNRHELENVVHKIIFPLKKDTDTISYEQHNLWLLDERLSFSEYVASDKPLEKGDERPDLLSFDRPIIVREGDELSNPITIFELKRPGRTAYREEENPLLQVGKYVQKIRAGNYKNPQGRPVYADENTPAYGFIICDLEPRIHDFCLAYGLTLSPDKQSYYGFNTGYRTYFEVISFDKVLKDATQRNKVFFRKLGID